MLRTFGFFFRELGVYFRDSPFCFELFGVFLEILKGFF